MLSTFFSILLFVGKIVLFLCLITLALSIALFCHLSPIFKPFPRPSGPHAVGSQSFSWLDQQRTTPMTHSTFQPRIVAVQIWYPTEGTVQAKPTAWYLPEKYAFFHRYISRYTRIPSWLLTPLIAFKTYEHPQAEPLTSSTGFPVVIFSPGLAMGKELYSAFAQELASNGFVVVGLDHQDDSFLTLAPNGRAVLLKDLFGSIDASASIEHKFDLMVEKRKADIDFVLHRLAELNSNQQHAFYGLFDFSHLGIMGHSLGGRTAFELCLSDPRFKAGINLDGDIAVADINKTTTTPLLCMIGELGFKHAPHLAPKDLVRFNVTQEQMKEYVCSVRPRIEHYCDKNSSTCSCLLIEGTTHNAFSDLALAKWPISISLRTQGIPGTHIIQVINIQAVRFFTKHLK
jgi:predicted dienelactone hydrolase